MPNTCGYYREWTAEERTAPEFRRRGTGECRYNPPEVHVTEEPQREGPPLLVVRSYWPPVDVTTCACSRRK